jgi:dihydropteroate synthase
MKEFRPSLFSDSYSVQIRGEIMDLSVPKVMGVINLTPDSFYPGSRFSDMEEIKKLIEQMIDEGADFIDIGAYSSRPGAKHIDESEELARLKPTLKLFKNQFPEVIVSLDTFRSSIAKIAVEEFGVSVINDISAGKLDKDLLNTVARLGVPYIMMHMQGTPQNMQNNPVYANLMKEISGFFANQVLVAREAGIKDIIIDPGFGFGKTLDHNYQLLQNLDILKIIDCPLLVGLSRKSMIYMFLNTDAADSLAGSIALNTIALFKGANILRVHDVKETVQAVKLFLKMQEFPIE